MKRIFIISMATLLIAGTTTTGRSFTTSDDAQEVTTRPRRVVFPGFLGVELDEVSREVAQRLSLREERGAIVSSVVRDSSAQKAGIQKDDVIVKWNGERIESAMELSRHLRETPSGRTVRLGVIRGGREMDVDVTLGDRSDYIARFDAERAKERAERELERQRERAERDKERQQQRAEREKERAARLVERQQEMAKRAQERMSVVRYSGRSRLGIQIQSMSPQLAEYFGLSGRNGALVVFVHADSPAAKAGIKAGDVILSIAGEKVESTPDVSRALRDKTEGPVEVRVMRDRREQTITVQIEKAEASAWLLDDTFDFIAPALDIVVLPKFAMTIPQIKLAPVRIKGPAFAPMPPVIVPKIVVPAPKITVPLAPVPMKLRTLPRFV
jgi:C-terminal processing protease CtpA/Prc